MPKTRFQELIFTGMMVLTMVYCMTLYNLSLEFGLAPETFQAAFWGMWAEVLAAFIAQRYIAGPVARKMVARMVTPGIDRPMLVTLAQNHAPWQAVGLSAKADLTTEWQDFHFRFTGTINKVTYNIKPEQLTVADREVMHRAVAAARDTPTQ